MINVFAKTFYVPFVLKSIIGHEECEMGRYSVILVQARHEHAALLNGNGSYFFT